MDDRMAKLRERFIARSRVDREALAGAFAGGNRVELGRIAHGLSGAGGLFGFPAISALASQLESGVDRNEPDSALQTKLDALTAALDQLK
jgi:HPt (histidine-containing phosphotransfer) domain-containing protein